MDQFLTMLVSVAGALAVSAVLFIGANRAVDNVRVRWPSFTAAVGGVVGLAVGAVVQHNGWVPRGPALGGPLKEGWIVMLACGAAGAVIAALAGRLTVPSLERRSGWSDRLRPWVFVGRRSYLWAAAWCFPACHGLPVAQERLQGPRARLHARPLQDIFTDDTFFTVEGWSAIFTGRLFIVGLVAVLAAAAAAWASSALIVGGGRRRPRRGPARGSRSQPWCWWPWS